LNRQTLRAQDDTWVESLEPLKDLTTLRSLSLNRTHINNVGLAPVAEFRNLASLELFRTRISDAGLASLAGLPNLNFLALIGMQEPFMAPVQRAEAGPQGLSRQASGAPGPGAGCDGRARPSKNGRALPKLGKPSVSMFVATATRGLTPSCIITGTVMNDVPPVTTLINAVKAKAATRHTKARADSSIAFSVTEIDCARNRVSNRLSVNETGL
jgi:hypothetical protein